jgi:hypothetical protein
MHAVSFERNGVHYYSNDYSPVEFFGAIKDANEIYVSPGLIEGKADQLVVNSMNLWQVVLIAEGRKAIQLVRAYDSESGQREGRLLYCQTNWATPIKACR